MALYLIQLYIHQVNEDEQRNYFLISFLGKKLYEDDKRDSRCMGNEVQELEKKRKTRTEEKGRKRRILFFIVWHQPYPFEQLASISKMIFGSHQHLHLPFPIIQEPWPTLAQLEP